MMDVVDIGETWTQILGGSNYIFYI